MSTSATGKASLDGAGYNKTKLFVLSVISLVTAGMVFSLRSSVLLDLQKVFFEPKDPLHAAGLVTAVAGVAFLGFAISVLVASPLCDYLGMGLCWPWRAFCISVARC